MLGKSLMNNTQVRLLNYIISMVQRYLKNSIIIKNAQVSYFSTREHPRIKLLKDFFLNMKGNRQQDTNDFFFNMKEK